MTDLIGDAPTPSFVKDATIETFQEDVLKASTEVPVIVDFWATWCGPCRTLGPMLEKQVNARGGAVRMVKVDTDKNKMLAQQLRIQSMPTVMVFVGGQPVDGFVGAVPESEISAFIDRSIATAEKMGVMGSASFDADATVKIGDDAAQSGDLQTAIESYSMVLEANDPESDAHSNALAGMAKCYLTADNHEQAKQLVAMIPAAKSTLPAVSQINAMLTLSSNTDTAIEMPTKSPTTPEGFFDLGTKYIDAGSMEAAIDSLLQSIKLDKEWNEGAARAKLLTVFDALGPVDSAVKSGRRKLSSLLFS